MIRRIFLGLLACLPVTWRIHVSAHADAYLPFDHMMYEDLYKVFGVACPSREGILYAQVGFERLDGTVGVQEYYGIATASSAVWEGGRLESVPFELRRMATREELLTLAHTLAIRDWPLWHRPGWLRIVTKSTPDGQWIPIRRIWPRKIG